MISPACVLPLTRPSFPEETLAPGNPTQNPSSLVNVDSLQETLDNHCNQPILEHWISVIPCMSSIAKSWSHSHSMVIGKNYSVTCPVHIQIHWTFEGSFENHTPDTGSVGFFCQPLSFHSGQLEISNGILRISGRDLPRPKVSANRPSSSHP